MIPNCSCACDCKQKLLTNTSKLRGYCSGCFIGNCRGKGLLFTDKVLKTYSGGRFETSKPHNLDSFELKEVHKNIVEAYGSYTIPTREALKESHNEEKSSA